MEKNDRSGMEKAAAPEMADWDCDIAYFCRCWIIS